MRLFLLFVFSLASLQGAQNPKEALSLLKYQLENCETDILVTQERILSQEATLDALRKEVEQSVQKTKEPVKKLSEELASLDKKINQLEKTLNTQSKNMKLLENALNSLIAALSEDGTSIALTNGENTYKVKNGDCLGTIAKKTGSSIKAIKQANNMTKDTIVVGQTLIIPPP